MARKDRRRKQVPTVMSFNWDSTPGPQALRPELSHFPASTGGAWPVCGCLLGRQTAGAGHCRCRQSAFHGGSGQLGKGSPTTQAPVLTALAL